jgi:hypothetical protein
VEEALMDQHADAGVQGGQRGRADQSRFETHRVGGYEECRPGQRGHDKGKTPPASEDHAK